MIGFTGLPSIKTQPTIVPNHLVVNGKSAMLMEPDTVAKELGSYRYGAAVIDGENPTAPLIGVYTGGADGAGVTLYGQVQSTLQRAGISAQRGAIDDAFGNAETFYEVQHYAHAIAPLQSVLKLDPQNAVATIQLADSKMKANTPADKSSSDVGVTTPTSKSGGLAWWVWGSLPSVCWRSSQLSASCCTAAAGETARGPARRPRWRFLTRVPATCLSSRWHMPNPHGSLANCQGVTLNRSLRMRRR